MCMCMCICICMCTCIHVQDCCFSVQALPQCPHGRCVSVGALPPCPTVAVSRSRHCHSAPRSLCLGPGTATVPPRSLCLGPGTATVPHGRCASVQALPQCPICMVSVSQSGHCWEHAGGSGLHWRILLFTAYMCMYMYMYLAPSAECRQGLLVLPLTSSHCG